MLGKIVFLISLLSFQVALANKDTKSECAEKLLSSEKETTDFNLILNKLLNLKPLFLDSPTLKDGMKNLIQELRNLKPSFESIAKINSLLSSKQISLDEAETALYELLEKNLTDANKNLHANYTTAQRKQLEGHRIITQSVLNLLEKIKNQRAIDEESKDQDELNKLLDEIEDESEDLSEDLKSSSQSNIEDPHEDKQSDPGQDSDNNSPSEKDERENQKDDHSDKQPVDQDSQDRIDELKQKIQKLQQELNDQKSNPQSQKNTEDSKSESSNNDNNSKDKNSDSQPAPSDQKEDKNKSSDNAKKSPENNQSKSDQSEPKPDKSVDEQLDDLQNKIDELQKKLEQAQDKKDQIDEKNKQESQSSEDQKEGSQKDSQTEESQSSDSQSGESQQPGESQSGESQSGESQQPGESQSGESQSGESQQPGESQSGESPSGEPSESSSSSNQPSDSQQSSNSSGKDQNTNFDPSKSDLSKALENYRKNKKSSNPENRDIESKTQKDKQAKTNPLDNTTANNQQSQDQDSKQQDSSQKSSELEDSGSFQQKTAKKDAYNNDAENKSESEDFKFEENIKKENYQNKDESEPLSANDVSKRYVHALWSSALRAYKSSHSLIDALVNFQENLRTLISIYPDSSFLHQYQKINSDLIQNLTQLSIQYSDIDHLKNQFMIGEHDREDSSSFRMLIYLKTILNQLQRVARLTSSEKQLLSSINTLLNQSSISPNSKKAFIHAFFAKLIGPISKSIVVEEHSQSGSAEDIDVLALHKAILAGKYNDLLIYSNFLRYILLPGPQRQEPLEKTNFKGERSIISKSNPELDSALDLSNYTRFYKDGSTLKQEIAKFISGDQLEVIHREETKQKVPDAPLPKKVSIILYDISGSMNQTKQLVRDAIINSYLDNVSKKVRSGKEKHTFYLIPFDGTPKDAEILSNYGLTKQAFISRRASPVQNHSGSTSITSAFNHSYDLIKRHQDNLGELRSANIILVTDGEDSISYSQVQQKIEQLPNPEKVFLHAINIQQHNSSLQDFTLKSKANLSQKNVFHWLRHDEMEELLDTSNIVSELKQLALLFSENPISRANNKDLSQFKTHLFNLKPLEKSIAPLIREDIGNRQELASTTHVLLKSIKANITKANLQNWSPEQVAAFLIELDKVARTHKVSVNQVLSELSNEMLEIINMKMKKLRGY